MCVDVWFYFFLDKQSGMAVPHYVIVSGGEVNPTISSGPEAYSSIFWSACS